MKTKLLIIGLVLFLYSCQSEDCWTFTSTAVTTYSNGNPVPSQPTTSSSVIYCGITKDEAKKMATSMNRTDKVGSYNVVTTVTVK